MKVLAFVDIHGSLNALDRLKKKAKKAELLLCAGDMTVFEQDIERMLKRLNSIGKKTLILHGNHETEDVMRSACRQFKNLIFLHKKSYKTDDCLFIGFGDLGFSVKDEALDRFAKRFKKEVKGKTILLTHAPPYNTRLDYVWGRHNGNKSIRRFIEKICPAVAVCGHFHENNGKEDKIKNTLVINPGPYGKIIEV